MVTTEGTPLGQGQVYECRYKLRNVWQTPVKQCGPIGDTQWVFDHFDFEHDAYAMACSSAGYPCVYEPDHLGWSELHP